MCNVEITRKNRNSVVYTSHRCVYMYIERVYTHICIKYYIGSNTSRNAIKRNKNVTSVVSPLDSKIDSRNFSPREYSQRDNISMEKNSKVCKDPTT